MSQIAGVGQTDAALREPVQNGFSSMTSEDFIEIIFTELSQQAWRNKLQYCPAEQGPLRSHEIQKKCVGHFLSPCQASVNPPVAI